MTTLLKRLLMQARLMDQNDEGSVGGNASDDLDQDEDDEDEDLEAVAARQEQKPALGEQDDGSVVLELDDEEGEKVEETKVEETKADDDREAIRERRRKERQDRKERQERAKQEQREELAAERAARQRLEQRLSELEGRDHTRTIAQVDAEIEGLAHGYNRAKAKLIEAHEQHDGTAAAEATEAMQSMQRKFEQLKTSRNALVEAAKKKPAATDDRVTKHVQSFMSKNSWYKHGSNDPDSVVVAALDSQLSSEGKSPVDQEYWDELNNRIKKYLPHRVASGKVSTSDAASGTKAGKDVPPRQTKSVVAGGGGDAQASSGKKIVTLSADRVKAIKDAGMWDDPKARADMIKRYQTYDKQNKG